MGFRRKRGAVDKRLKDPDGSLGVLSGEAFFGLGQAAVKARLPSALTARKGQGGRGQPDQGRSHCHGGRGVKSEGLGGKAGRLKP